MQLFELRDRVLTLPALEKRMESLTQDIRKAEDEVSSLLQQYKRETVAIGTTALMKQTHLCRWL